MVTIDQGSKNKEIEIKNKMFESYELTNPRKEFFIIIANKIIQLKIRMMNRVENQSKIIVTLLEPHHHQRFKFNLRNEHILFFCSNFI